MRVSILVASLLSSLAVAQIPRTTGGSLTIPSSIPNTFSAVPIPSTVTGEAYCSSQGLGLPPCAIPCILDAADEVGCPGLNFPCQCNLFTANIGYAEQCVVTSCGLAVGLIVQSSVTAICECFASFPALEASATPGLGEFTVSTELYTEDGAVATSYVVSTAASLLPVETGYFKNAGESLGPAGVFGALIGVAAAAM